MEDKELQKLLDRVLWVMVCMIVSFTLYLLAGCSNEITEADKIRTGEIVAPPYGCVELRKRGGEC